MLLLSKLPITRNLLYFFRHPIWLNMYSLFKWQVNQFMLRSASYTQSVTHCRMSSYKCSKPGQCFYNNSHPAQECWPEWTDTCHQNLSEPKYNVKMHSVLKTDRPDPERGIPDKWDKITFKKSVPNENHPDTDASRYLRVHCT